MRVFNYVLCFVAIFVISALPVIDPIKSSIITSISDVVLYDSYYISATFTSSLMPQILSMSIMIVGSFVMYCVYRGYECTWRSEKLKDEIFVPQYFNAVDGTVPVKTTNVKAIDGGLDS